MIWPSKVGMVGLSIKKNRKSISSQKNSKKGFTLVELIVVLVILAIMAAAIVPALLGFTDNAKEKEYKADAEACLKASQTTLSDLYTDSANKLTPDKRVSAANMANVSPTGTTFKVWTSKSLEDGKTPATMDNMGSYTIVYAYYATSNDDNAKYLFFDGKEWTVFSEQNEVLEVIYNKGLITAKSVAALDTTDFSDSKNSTIIHMWPYHSDTAYVTDKEYAEANEEWKENQTSITKTVNIKLAHNGKSNPSPGDLHGVVLDYGTNQGVELEEPAIQLTFEINADNPTDVTCDSWKNFGTENEEFVYNGVKYKVRTESGYTDLMWSTSDSVRPSNNNWNDIISGIMASNEDTVNVYAWTTKTYSPYTAVFTAKENSVFEIDGATNNEVTVTCYKYDNIYDEFYDNNSDIPVSGGIVSGLSNISNDKMKPASWDFKGWAYEKDNVVETISSSNSYPKAYFANGIDAGNVWSKVCADKTNKRFLGILEKTKNVTLKAGKGADDKYHSHFGTAKTVRQVVLSMTEKDFTGEVTDDFMTYRNNIIDIEDNYRFLHWNLVSKDGIDLSVPESTDTRRVGNLRAFVEASDSTELVYEAELAEKTGAKFIEGTADDAKLTTKGMITQMGNGSRVRICGIYRDDFDNAVAILNRKEQLDGKGMFDDKIYISNDNDLDENNEVDGDVVFDRVANISFGGYDNPKGFNPKVNSGTNCAYYQVDDQSVHRIFILWDGNDPNHETPIFAYTVPVDKSQNYAPVNDFVRLNENHFLEIHWFTEDPNPELIGDFSGLFSGCTEMAINSASGLETFDVSGCTNMSNMFNGCTKIADSKEIVSNWDMSSVENVSYMFKGCTGLTTADLSSCTIGASNISNIFDSCTNITSADYSDCNLSSATSASGMFNNCPNLSTINFKNCNLSSLQNGSALFKDLANVTSIDMSQCDLSNATTISNLFQGCNSLTTVNFSQLKLGSVQSISSLFKGKTNLTSVNLSQCDMSSVTDASSLFEGCTSITDSKAIISNWDMSSIENISAMFKGCTGLTTADLSSCTIGASNISNIFNGCMNITTADYSNCNLSSVTSASGMFNNCPNISTINFKNCNLSSLQNSSGLFKYLTSITSIDMTKCDLSSATTVSSLFEGCSGLTSINLEQSNMSSVTNVSKMFEGCNNLTTVNLSYLNISSVQSVYGLFKGKTNLTSVNLSQCNLSGATNTSSMFEGCTGLTTLNLSQCNLTSASNLSSMFNGCSSLENVDASNWIIKNVGRGDNANNAGFNKMFKNCTSLRKIKIKVTSSEMSDQQVSLNYMFDGCTQLTSVSFVDMDVNKVQQLKCIFTGCTSYNSTSLKNTMDGFNLANDTYNLFGQKKNSDGWNSLYESGRCNDEFMQGSSSPVYINNTGTSRNKTLVIGGGNSALERRLKYQ